ncbi:hypothetical protein FOZ61_011077 [Perkinsus olseni]|uniref:Uncharacterized protein n=1 Tax=Perkinsus olseni TaxID=32597 RepID=A0A7J6M2I1_PEROL|nr:hypothetical protein FOZ61_011077 [Perkinsus olseni]KAF4671692.1 hypothetical protein FOL46_009987 [Perkinsus olseni]
MLSVILVIGVLISVNDAYLPNGNFAGRVSSPYLFVDCTFIPASGVSSVHMVVGCDKQQPAAVGRFEIEPAADYPDRYLIVGSQSPSHRSMMDELKRMCPWRGFKNNDFMRFNRVKGNVTAEDDYRVYYDTARRSVLLKQLSSTPYPDWWSRA